MWIVESMFKEILTLGVLALAGMSVSPSIVYAQDTTAENASKKMKSDLNQDPQIVEGVLPNGLRYIIRPNAEPKGRVSVRLYVDVGSLSETDDERGLSHFLEHMVFGGSGNFPVGEVIPTMQRHGLTFGRDVNAFTSFDQTVYMVDTPDLKPESLDFTMKLMRDFTDGALFDEAALNRERGVIINELKTRDSVEYRILKHNLGFLLNGLNHVNRLPIGVEEVITKTPRQKFVDYHKKHYAADQVVLVLVGDITPEKGKELVAEYFGSLQASGLKNTPNIGTWIEPKGLGVKIIDEPELPTVQLGLLNLKKYEKEPDTIASRLKTLPLDMAMMMLNRRLELLTKKEGCPFVGAGASSDTLFDEVTMTGINAAAEPNKWKPALEKIEQEMRKAVEFGFTADEYEEAKKSIIQSMEQDAATWSTRPSRDIANAIISSIGDKKIFISPEETQRITLPALEALNAELCSQALKAEWKPDKIQIMATGKIDIPGGEKEREEELKEVVLASQKVAVEPPAARENKPFAYDKVGEPGKIADKVNVEDLGIVQMKLSNGILVNYKQTDFQKDTIGVTANVAGGTLTLPKGKSGLDTVAGIVMNGGGLEAHDNDALQRLFAGHRVGVGFSLSEDNFTLSGETNRKDLGLELKLLSAYLEHAGYNPESLVPFKRAIPTYYEKQARESTGVYGMESSKLLLGDDYRFNFPKEDQLSSYTVEDVREWINPALKENAIEVSIVGDFDPKELEALLEQTIGALPARATEPPVVSDAMKEISLQAPGKEHVLTYPTQLDKSLTTVTWLGPDGSDKSLQPKLNILSQIFSNRIREDIREKMGDAYSPRGSMTNSKYYKDYGFFTASSPGTSENSARVAKALQEMGDRLASDSITEDELERIRKPYLATLEKSRRENPYWNGVLIDSQRDKDKLDRIRKIEEVVKSLTVDELNALAKKIFPSSNSTIIRVVPAKENSAENPAGNATDKKVDQTEKTNPQTTSRSTVDKAAASSSDAVASSSGVATSSASEIATAYYAPLPGEYVVALSEETASLPEWKAVADRLVEAYKGKVFF